MARVAFRTDLPEQLAVLAELALDLRWTWSHAGDDLWRMIPRCGSARATPGHSCRTSRASGSRKLARNADFLEELRNLIGLRERYLNEPFIAWADAQAVRLSGAAS